MIRRLMLIAALLPTFLLGQDDNNLLAREWSGLAVPHPQRDFLDCGFDAPGTVCDPDALLLDDDMKMKLQAKLDAVEHHSRNLSIRRGANGATACQHNEEVVKFWVVMVDGIARQRPSVPTPTDADMSVFAERIRTTNYKLALEACRNYILIVAVKELQLVLVTKGVHVPDDVKVQPGDYLTEEVQTQLANGRLSEAVILIADRVDGHLKSAPTLETNLAEPRVQTAAVADRAEWPWYWLLIAAIILAVLLVLCLLCAYCVWLAAYRRRRTGKWSMIPITVRKLTNTDAVVYPESILTDHAHRTYSNNDPCATPLPGQYRTLEKSAGYTTTTVGTQSPIQTPLYDSPDLLDAVSLASSHISGHGQAFADEKATAKHATLVSRR